MPLEPQLGGVGYVLRKFPVLSETFILNEILALERMGIPVHVFPLQPSRDPRFHEGVVRLKASIHHVPGPADWRALKRHAKRLAGRHGRRFRAELLAVLATGRPSLLWRFVQAAWVADRARRFKVEHLHAHFANRATTVARLSARLIGVPYSFTAHAFDIYRDADLPVIARKMQDAAFTVTVSEHNVAFLEDVLGGRPARIELVRNGIDLGRFHEPLQAPAEPFTILAVARFVEKKGLPVLVEACRLLHERGRRFRCRIVGKGAQRSLLERLVREGGLQDVVALLPPHSQEEIVERFHEAHVLALPCQVGRDGNRDGLPVSIVEALACGLPVVSTPVTGIPEAVVHESNGLLVPERDPQALAEALERLMDDGELLARLRGEARASVAEAYDEQLTARRLHDLFRETVRAVSEDAEPRPVESAGGGLR